MGRIQRHFGAVLSLRRAIRFDSIHNKAATESLEAYVSGQQVSIDGTSLHTKIRKWFDNNREKQKRSVSKAEASKARSRRFGRKYNVRANEGFPHNSSQDSVQAEAAQSSQASREP